LIEYSSFIYLTGTVAADEAADILYRMMMMMMLVD